MKKKNKKKFNKILIGFFSIIVALGFFILGLGHRLTFISNTLDYLELKTYDLLYFIKLKPLCTKKSSLNKNTPIEEVIVTVGGETFINETEENFNNLDKKVHPLSFSALNTLVENDDITLLKLKYSKQDSHNSKEASYPYKTLKSSSIELVNLCSYNSESKYNFYSDYTNCLNYDSCWLADIKGNKITFLVIDISKKNMKELKSLRNKIFSYKKENCVVIVNLDGDYKKANDGYIEFLSHFIINSGANVVINNKKAIAPTEKYKKGFIIHGLNGLCSKEDNKLNGFIYQFSFVFSERNLFTMGIKAIPYECSYNKNTSTYTPSLIEGNKKNEMLKNLNQVSKNLDFKISDKFTFLDMPN